MLTTNEVLEIFTDGKPGIAERIRLEYESNQLEIIAPNFTGKMKHVMKIPAHQLQYIEINGDGQVYSESYIAAPDMEIFINGQGHVSVCSTGKIVIKVVPEYEIQFARKEGNVTVAPFAY